ncbi:signal recognition particle receptor subunit beta-like [Clavelina lepadiformis]|uniref:signal recognition particle receptor subunit beta-like n=1 Tax=Clavelina lepadiformis TaxID=159417 RepID=UPI0040419AC7
MERSCCEVRLEMSSSIEYYNQLMKDAGVDGGVFAVLIGLFIVFCTAVLWRFITGSSSKRDGVLLIGLSDAGKTNLFSQLVSGTGRSTQTSLKENEASYAVEGAKRSESLTLLDLPGHEAIRQQFVEKFKDKARGIVYIVDSETFQKNIKDVAEFLFQILTDKSINKMSPKVCIACNKQDKLMAKSKKVIQSQLEKELNTVRKTQSAALSSTSGSGDDNVYLGMKGEEFQFSHVKKFKVEFLECNAKSDDGAKSNIDEVKSWIASVV